MKYAIYLLVGMLGMSSIAQETEIVGSVELMVPDDSVLHEKVNQRSTTLALRPGATQELLAQQVGTALEVTLTLEHGFSWPAIVQRYDLFTPDAKTVVMTDEGEIEVARTDLAFYRGTFLDFDDSSVEFTVAGDHVIGTAVLDGEQYRFGPIWDDERNMVHVAMPFEEINLFPRGVDLDRLAASLSEEEFVPLADDSIPAVEDDRAPRQTRKKGMRTIELALDGDFELYTLMGNNSSATFSYYASLVNAVNVIYNRDLNINLVISFQRVWATEGVVNGESYPYLAVDSMEALNEVKNHWNTQKACVRRNIVYLLSGKSLPFIIPKGGGAWPGSYCEEGGGYGQSKIHGTASSQTQEGLFDIVNLAHEIGHTLGADHTHCYGIDACNQPSTQMDPCEPGNPSCGQGTIMSYCLYCGGTPFNMNNIVLEFHPAVIGIINDFLNQCNRPGRIDPYALIYEPAAGTVLDDTSVTVAWSKACPEVTQYRIYAGSERGGTQYFSRSFSANRHDAVVDNLPEDGSTIHLRMWSRVNGVWRFKDTTLQAVRRPRITSPQPGSTLSGATQIFTWDTNRTNMDGISIGTNRGGNDLFNAVLDDTQTSISVTDLPMDGSTIFVRLNYNFRMGSGPVPGSVDFEFQAVSSSIPPSLTPRKGQWYNPSRSGNGIDFQPVGGNQWQLVFYTYRAANSTPIWYRSDAGLLSGSGWQAGLNEYRLVNGQAQITPVGSVQLNFSSTTRAVFSWTINNNGTEPASSRSEMFEFLIGMSTGITGQWLPNGQTHQGWGYHLTEHFAFNPPFSGQQLFAGIYFYRPDGSPTWAVTNAPGNWYANPSITSLLFRRGFNLCPSCSGTPFWQDSAAGTLNISLGSPNANSGTINAVVAVPPGADPSFPGGYSWNRNTGVTKSTQ